jgi:hypothetical protein
MPIKLILYSQKNQKIFSNFYTFLINVFTIKIKIEIIIMTYQQSIAPLSQPKNLIF